MLVNCIGLYAQQVMETSEAYKKADELLKKLTIEEKALMVRGYNKFLSKVLKKKEYFLFICRMRHKGLISGIICLILML